MPVMGDGNFCGKCDKIVIDFTKYSDEELVNYFSGKKEKNICGHFKKSQVKLPKLKFRQSRFLAALMMVFGSLLFSSCGNDACDDDTVDGGIGPMMDSIPQNADSIRKADSIEATTSYHMSKEDSTKIADSIARTKNQIRDFN